MPEHTDLKRNLQFYITKVMGRTSVSNNRGRSWPVWFIHWRRDWILQVYSNIDPQLWDSWKENHTKLQAHKQSYLSPTPIKEAAMQETKTTAENYKWSKWREQRTVICPAPVNKSTTQLLHQSVRNIAEGGAKQLIRRERGSPGNLTWDSVSWK